MDSTTLLVAAVVAVAVLGAVWFGVRFWLASTRPADIKDVHTPALDRLNRAALEGGDEAQAGEDEEEAVETIEDDEDDFQDEDPPAGLKDLASEK